VPNLIRMMVLMSKIAIISDRYEKTDRQCSGDIRFRFWTRAAHSGPDGMQ
jgi:hypothetical protein